MEFLTNNTLSPLAKAKRVRSARMLTGLNRNQLQEKYGLHVNTIKSWEKPSPNHKGLTDKGAERFIQILQQEGIQCSVEWLLTGQGKGPALTNAIDEQGDFEIPNISIGQDESILKEVQFFLDINPSAIAMMINSNNMSPYYEVGDYVGGYKRFGDDIKQLINCNCIIEDENDIMHAARFITAEKAGYYQLVYLNELSHQNASDNLIKIKSAARIVWYRKKDPNYKWSVE